MNIGINTVCFNSENMQCLTFKKEGVTLYMSVMTNIGNAIELLEQNDKSGKLALSLIDSFLQLPKWFHMAFLGDA